MTNEYVDQNVQIAMTSFLHKQKTLFKCVCVCEWRGVGWGVKVTFGTLVRNIWRFHEIVRAKDDCD